MKQYAKRKLDFTFNYGHGPNGEQEGESVTLSGLRASVNLAIFGGASNSTAQFRIYGLPMPMMNRLTRIGTIQNEFRINNILIAAGDEGGALSVAHQGTINTAHADFNGAPEVLFEGLSYPELIPAMKPVNARSYPDTVDAADVMDSIAQEIGAKFENNGVSVILNHPYFPGTAWAQVESCANAANINYLLDRGVLSIWPKSGARTSQPIVKVAPDTGMVGYPTFNSYGIGVRTLFNPDVHLGSLIEVDTDLTAARGKWVAYSVAHSLESETPNGAWFTDIQAHSAIGL